MTSAGKDFLRGLRGERIVSPTPEQAAGALAARLSEHLVRRLVVASVAHIALSGGSSARLLGSALAESGALTSSQWSRVHVWMVDERCVSDDDPRLNAGLVREVLVASDLLPAANLHPMPVLDADGAVRYEADLRHALAATRDSSHDRLDAVVLGMGADGHTASLFPGSPALDEGERLVVLNDGESVAPPRPRMTMTYSVLNHARLIALLVTGASKNSALKRAAENPSDFHALPVTGVIPDPGSPLIWYLDREAAKRPFSK